MLDPAAIADRILGDLADVHLDSSTPDLFFFRDPDRTFPFATIVTRDNDFDRYSHLDRDGVFRLNVGVGGDTFRALFGAPLPKSVDPTGFADRHDFTALGVLIPHPAYGRQFWVSVLNPSPEIFETVRPLLAEAHDLAGRR